VFRSGVELVQVDAVALDASGRPVMDLAKNEFLLFEDGVQREIVSFAQVSSPVKPPEDPPVVDVTTNRTGSRGRLFFLILDDVNTLRGETETVRAIARRLVQRLSPDDQIAVQWVSLHADGAREFSTNHAVAMRAIDAFTARMTRVGRQWRPGGGLLSDGLDEIEGIDLQTRAFSARDLQREFEQHRLFVMVRDVSTYLASIIGRRKAIVYIGQGHGRALLRDDGPLQDFDHKVIQAMTAARRANVSFYSIDPSRSVRPHDLLSGGDPRPLRAVIRGRGADAAAAFGEATGGFGAAGPDLETVDRILVESGNYYLLGYHTVAPKSSGGFLGFFKPLRTKLWSGFRSIEVRTTRPGVRIRARKGFWTTTRLVRRGFSSRRTIASGSSGPSPTSFPTHRCP
jgi:VWFA-related protein